MDLDELYKLVVKHQGNLQKAALEAKIPRSTIWARLKKAGLLSQLRQGGTTKENIVVDQKKTTAQITYVGTQINTVDELLASAGIDINQYEIERLIINNWEVTGSNKSELWKSPNKQIKVILKRRKSPLLDMTVLLDKLAAHACVSPLYRSVAASTTKRALEISIMDPHYGLQCFKGASDHDWNLETCRDLCFWSVENLLGLAQAHGGYEEIIFPFGNDFLHHDNLQHTTTRGTLQPEGMAYTHVYETAITLAVTLVERLAKVAPVRIIQISGNHDEVSTFSLGHLLKAYFRHNTSITCDVSSSPYKFYRYGVNLIGFDHGHHINTMRLGNIMAQERPKDWSETLYREWHLGDQHRKGTGKPSVMEEMGVSVEFLPALTPANAWHKQKGFNWQKRGAMAFVWDYNQGPVARLQVNLNSYTGQPMGQSG